MRRFAMENILEFLMDQGVLEDFAINGKNVTIKIPQDDEFYILEQDD